jgi:hypothetical protein
MTSVQLRNSSIDGLHEVEQLQVDSQDVHRALILTLTLTLTLALALALAVNLAVHLGLAIGAQQR